MYATFTTLHTGSSRMVSCQKRWISDIFNKKKINLPCCDVGFKWLEFGPCESNKDKRILHFLFMDDVYFSMASSAVYRVLYHIICSNVNNDLKFWEWWQKKYILRLKRIGTSLHGYSQCWMNGLYGLLVF